MKLILPHRVYQFIDRHLADIAPDPRSNRRQPGLEEVSFYLINSHYTYQFLTENYNWVSYSPSDSLSLPSQPSDSLELSRMSHLRDNGLHGLQANASLQHLLPMLLHCIVSESYSVKETREQCSPIEVGHTSGQTISVELLLQNLQGRNPNIGHRSKFKSRTPRTMEIQKR